MLDMRRPFGYNPPMFNRLFILFLTLTALTACVLQSPEPLFAEQQGVLVLKGLGTRFSTETFADGAWKADEGVITFTAEGQHYIASNAKDKATVPMLFVKLGGARYVLQAREGTDKPVIYLIAEVKDRRLQLQPLFCDELKKLPKAAETATFENMDCTIKGTPGTSTFSTLAGQIAPAKLRLVPVE
jgi:hypothetical protein